MKLKGRPQGRLFSCADSLETESVLAHLLRLLNCLVVVPRTARRNLCRARQKVRRGRGAVATLDLSEATPRGKFKDFGRPTIQVRRHCSALLELHCASTR